MKKLFTRAAAIIMGISMAAGVGVAIARDMNAVPVSAESTTYTITGETWTTNNGNWISITNLDGTQAAGKYAAVSGGSTALSPVKYIGISSISMSGSKSKAGQGTIEFFYGEDQSSTGSWTTLGSKSVTASGKAFSDQVWSDLSCSGYLKIVVTVNSGNFYISGITVTYDSIDGGGGGDTPTLSSIAVKTAPSKVSYTEGEYFDPTGLVITRTYSSGDPSDYAYAGHESDFSFSPATNVALTTTDTAVQITYGGKTCNQAITVEAASVEGYVMTLSNSGVSGSSYNSGAERTTTINNVGFGSKGSMANTGRIQLQGSNGIIYNTTAFPAAIEKVTLVQEGTNRAMSLQAGSSARLVNNTTGDYTITGGSTTGITAPSTAATMTWTFAGSTNYTYFALKVAASNTVYAASITVVLRSTNDTTTALSVSPTSWSGYDTDTINVSDYAVTCTTSASDDGYHFQGIGSGEGDNFVARVIDFTSGNPTAADTRLQWKANYPTTEGGSTYLYAYVTLTVTEDTLSTVTVSGSMTKKSYYAGEEWNRAGLTATATYKSGKQTDVTEQAVWTYSPASPVVSVTSVVATATFGGKSGSSSAQSVTVSKANPIQALYTKASGASVDVYGYYVGFLDGTGPVIMDGDYGIVIYNKTADVTGYTENETILHVTGSISIYKGLYEIGSATMSIASGTFTTPDTPVVYTTTGNETADYASRLTTVTGTPSVEGSPFDSDAGTNDITITFIVGAKTVKVFYKKAAQTADATAYASMKAAVEASKEITIKGFTGWYDGFQVQMNGVVEAVETYTAEDFAQDLLDQTDAVCTGWEEGDDNHDALVGIWSNLASADKYPSLPSEQKTILAEAERNENGTVVEQAMARYDFLTGKYNLNNFINGRTPVVINSIYNNTTINATNANIIAIIVIASIALVATTGAVTAIIIKKRATH